MAIPDLLSPKSIGLPFDRDTADSAAAHRTGALVAAELGLVRGDLWTKAAFTGAPFLWTARPANLDPAELKQLARVRNTTETALALAPINGATWLFLAKLPATSPETESRIGNLLEMSYFTAPSAPDLALPRIQRAVTSSALANKDLQTFVSGDLREILSRGPQFQQAIIAAYRDALPQIERFSNRLSPTPIRPPRKCCTPARPNETPPRDLKPRLETGIKFAWSPGPWI